MYPERWGGGSFQELQEWGEFVYGMAHELCDACMMIHTWHILLTEQFADPVLQFAGI